MKCSHLETSTKTAAPIVGERLELCSPSNKDERFFKPMMPSINDDFLYQRTSLLNQRASRTFYDNSRDPRRTAGADNDLKFVLYMYEVRKMRNIFGRISTIFEVVCQKRYANDHILFKCPKTLKVLNISLEMHLWKWMNYRSKVPYTKIYIN